MMSAKLWAPALTACALATSIALVGCSKDPKNAQQTAAAQKCHLQKSVSSLHNHKALNKT
jgi:hypothetical protein